MVGRRLNRDGGLEVGTLDRPVEDDGEPLTDAGDFATALFLSTTYLTRGPLVLLPRAAFGIATILVAYALFFVSFTFSDRVHNPWPEERRVDVSRQRK